MSRKQITVDEIFALKVIEVSGWDMDTDSSVNIDLSLYDIVAGTVKGIASCMILNDAGTVLSTIEAGASSVTFDVTGKAYVSQVANLLYMFRTTGGEYDNAGYSGAGVRAIVTLLIQS